MVLILCRKFSTIVAYRNFTGSIILDVYYSTLIYYFVLYLDIILYRRSFKMDWEKLLRSILERKASDLHLDVACSPVMRINGELIKREDIPPLSKRDI